MQPFGRNRYGPKIRGAVSLWGGELGPHVARAETYLCAKFHLSQTGQDRTDRTDNGLIE